MSLLRCGSCHTQAELVLAIPFDLFQLRLKVRNPLPERLNDCVRVNKMAPIVFAATAMIAGCRTICRKRIC